MLNFNSFSKQCSVMFVDTKSKLIVKCSVMHILPNVTQFVETFLFLCWHQNQNDSVRKGHTQGHSWCQYDLGPKVKSTLCVTQKPIHTGLEFFVSSFRPELQFVPRADLSQRIQSPDPGFLCLENESFYP